MKRVFIWMTMLTVLGATARAQEGSDRLEQAVEQARSHWLTHDVGHLFATSDTVRLQVPGTVASASMKPGQAGMLLQKYLRASEEVGLDLVRIRRLAEDHAYAELVRSYTVKGTSEERSERVFLGFQDLGETWRLREVRVTP